MARLLSLWWIPFAAALAAVIAWETNWGEALHSPLVSTPVPEAKPVAPALLPEYKPNTEPEAYAEVIDRPLFSPTRRQAPPPPPPEPPKQVMQTGQYQLTGTMQVGDKFYAFLKETKGGKGVRATQGDMLSGGIKVSKVEPDRVLLSQYDSEEEVKLLVSKSTRTTPVPTPAPGALAAQPGGASVPQPTSVRPNVEPVRSPNPAGGQPTGAPFVPGVATLAPFVPGVSGAPAPRNEGSSDVPPRRRGQMQ